MSSDDSQLAEKIARWVQESGFPLEMRIRKAMLPYLQTVPSAYLDPQTAKYREGADVVGCTGKVTNLREDNLDQLRSYMFAVVECKSGDKKPWVGFLHDYEESDELSSICMVQHLTASEEMRNIVERIVRPEYLRTLEPLLSASSPFRAPRKMAYSIMEYKNNDRKERSVPHNAIQQVIDGAGGVIREFESFWSDPRHRNKFISASVNFIVTRSRIFTCELDIDGKELVKETDNLVFLASLGQGQQQRYHYVRVMREESFISSMEAIRDDLKIINDHLMQVLIDHHEQAVV